MSKGECLRLQETTNDNRPDGPGEDHG